MRSLFTLAILAAACGFTTCARSNDRVVIEPAPTLSPTSTVKTGSAWPEADLEVNGIRSGTTYEEIVKRIGKPTSVKDVGKDACTDGMMRTLYYPGLKIELESDEKKRHYAVTAFEVTSGNWLIGGAFRIGDAPDAVTRRYGSPHSESSQDHLEYVSRDDLGMVDFKFENGKLIMARLQETLC